MNHDPNSQFEPTDPRGDVLPETRVVGSSSPHLGPPLQAAAQPGAGMQVGEFLLLEELGRGAFGQVFLAGQEALNRRVALKVSRLRAMSADEGKSLGGLEHDHIVKVYSAFTHPETGWHCLCLQYVPGADMRSVIDQLYRNGAPSGGRDLLAAVDAVGRKDATFDPAALRDRDSLGADDFAQAVCRIGGQLADALAFAHAKGVLHCDVKPGNILLTPYGRPMLADFNVAFDRSRRGDEGGLGGTRAYMAPEHAAALRDSNPAGVDGRCDIYSLGVVLLELATGRRDLEALDEALVEAPRELAAVIRRCLEHDPSRRYQTASALAAALSGAWQLLAARRALPTPQRLGRWVMARPILALATVGVFPHLIASIVNIAFNSVKIDLQGEQKNAFVATVLAYNLIVYPLVVGAVIVLFRRVARRLPDLPRMPGPEVDRLRRRVRKLGWQSALAGAIGWFPGGLIFPLAIDRMAGPFAHPASIYLAFAVSFTLSGLIGVVFSYLGVQYVVFRSLLPRMGNPDTFTPEAASSEVRPLIAPFGVLVVLASAIPLTGAILLIAFAEGTMTLGFRLLAAGLIGVGASGVGIADRGVRRIYRLAAVWGVVEGESEAAADRSNWNGSRSSVYVRTLHSS